MKIGITGSSGVLGQRLISYLNNYNLSKFRGDITSNFEVEKWIKYSNFDAIIHLAAVVPVDLVNKNKILAKKVNYEGTKIIIDNLKKFYSKKIWFFYASTSHVYEKSDFILKENSKIKTLNYYALTKFQSEQYLIKNSEIVNFCIGRIFSYTSKNQSINFLIPNLISKLNKDENEIYLKNLNHYRDFLPIDDIVNAIKILLKNKQKGVFNICSSREILLSDIARKLNFKQKNLFFDNAKSSTKIVGSNKKLRSLKWKPSYKNYLNYISKYKKY